MSLSDRYNRGGGRIQSLDQYLTHLGNRIGNVWFNQTGIHRKSLTQGLYVLSAIAATQHFSLSKDPFSLMFVVVALLSYLGATPALGGLVEQIQAEAAGLPKNFIALMRLEVICVGLFLLFTAIGELAAHLFAGAPLTSGVAHNLLLGCALTALQGSDYIRRTNPATPSSGGRGGGLKRILG